MREYLIAGFGGQGVLFTGKLISNIALLKGQHTTWMPSYGPEMRGGTCNCGVVVSDKLIGSPVVKEPDCLIALNGPSCDKFISKVRKGGTAYIDCAKVSGRYENDDIDSQYIPASDLLKKDGITDLANMVLLGKMIKDLDLADLDTVKKAVEMSVSSDRVDLIESNIKALQIGMGL